MDYKNMNQEDTELINQMLTAIKEGDMDTCLRIYTKLKSKGYSLQLIENIETLFTNEGK